MEARNWRVAVIGAGPSGLYGADALLKRGAAVDVFERQFAPFGLVRYGVAPDHQKIKKTQALFQKILDKPGLRLFSNVDVGVDVTVSELQEEYDQVLITMGSSGARDLGIDGEQLPGSVSATELVNWYNGHPFFAHAAPSLGHERAVVVGMGNVAIDVARILLRNPDELASTDIASEALEHLRGSVVREVILLARRGPNQAAFDQKEVRELASLEGIEVGTTGYVSKRSTPMSDFLSSFPRAEALTAPKRVILHFCASPIRLLGDTCVTGVRIERNDLVESAARMRAVGTGDFSEIEAGLVVRAIGYHGEALLGVPYNDDTGTIPNDEGRVLTERGGPRIAGLYVAGWIKRGPTGLIGTNEGCAVDTVARMEEDLDQVGPERDPLAIVRLLESRGVHFLTSDDWHLIDQYELTIGERLGKVREKVTDLKTAFDILKDAKGEPSKVRASMKQQTAKTEAN